MERTAARIKDPRQTTNNVYKKTFEVSRKDTKPQKITLPEKELNMWLQNRTSWNHDEWLQLLADLDKKGYGELTKTQEGRDSIGIFLTTNRH